MSANFRVVLDTIPPVTPSIVVADGDSFTGLNVVEVRLSSPSSDLTEMLIWGDLDPAIDPRYQNVEEESQWTLFDPEGVYVQLSTGSGRKNLYARLRDDVHNQTPIVSAWIDLDETLPTVSIVTPADRALLSLVDGYDITTFGWQVNLDFEEYEVRVVPAASSPRTAGNPVISATGSFDADTTIISAVTTTMIRNASVGDGPKVIKVFVRSGAQWSA